MAAIYQWFTGAEVIYTTTLYPVYTQAQFQPSVELSYAYLLPLPVQTLAENNALIVDGSVTTILLTHSEQQDLVTNNATMGTGSVTTILLTENEADTLATNNAIISTGSVTSKLVTGYSPPGRVQTLVDLVPSSCDLTPV